VDEIQFADGFDAPDRLAFGLGAGQLVVVVVAGLMAYALLRAPLPGAIAGPVAASIVAVAAGLAWLRLGGRPALDWAVFAARYAARPHAGAFDLSLAGRTAAAAPSLAEAPAPDVARNVIPLRLDRRHAVARRRLVMRDVATAPPPASHATVAHRHPAGSRRPRALRVGGAHRITFFSLKGGTGRTTLAVELAGALAAPPHDPRGGTAALSVALLDLDLRGGNIAVRLRLAHPGLMEFALAEPDERHLHDYLVAHASGVQVLLGASRVRNSDWPVTAPLLREILRELDLDGFDVVVMDVSPDLNGVTRAALNSSDDVFVVVVPTASGVQDAYRTTEQLRHAGLRHRLRYVVNRATRDADISVTIADLAGELVAEIPEDAALAAAERSHRLASVDGDGDAARALQRLARRIRSELSFSCAT
jgi:MinD-like ATPase involved in chromosome partitioning or flagellar assembly